MADTKIRTRKATALLKDDHRKVKKLFASYEKLDEEDEAEKERLYEQIRKELTLHARIEEEVFYPAVKSSDDKDALKRVQEAHEEHKIVKTLLAELEDLEDDVGECDAKMKVLQDTVLHHAAEEEREIFPLFEDLDKEEKDRVAEELSALKQKLESEDLAEFGRSEEPE